jgi:hypothetical protein
MKKISYSVLIAFAAALSHADTLAWRVPDTEWGAWHNPANWALEKPDGEPAGRIPGFDDRFFPEQTFRFDLGGKTGQIGHWSINSWTQRNLFLTNGTLEVAGPWPIHGGRIEICHGATLRFRPGAFFMPGASDAAGRLVRVLPGGVFDLTDVDVNLFNGAFDIEPGAVARLGARSWRHSFKAKFRISNRGRMELPRGFAYEDGNQGGASIILSEGSETTIGGNLSGSARGSVVEMLVEGGRIAVTGDTSWNGASVFIQTNATVEINVPEACVADLSSVVWGPGTTLRKTGPGILGLGASRPASIEESNSSTPPPTNSSTPPPTHSTIVPADSPAFRAMARAAQLRKLEFTVEGDSANRCYFITFPERLTGLVERVTYTFPQPDAGREDGLWSVTTRLPYFHRRYPPSADKAPFTVNARAETVDGLVFSTNIVVRFNPKPIGKPAPNEQVFIGMVSYGPGRERYEMVTNDLANLYVRWNAHKRLLPENANSEIVPDWMERAEKIGIRSMTIYGTTPRDLRDRIKAAWGDRYLGNNVGERTGFLYGTWKEMSGPNNVDLDTAREWFICRFMHRMQGKMVRGAPGEDPFFFTTSGASFSGYELAGGADYVCNELYAVGCNNLIYAQSEARGAARRWGPEWWCGWLAHEWQTFGVPYESEKKYATLEAGMKALWVLGTSLMCLESGSSGTQANQYTWGVPEDRRKKPYSYDEDPPRRYRETVRKVYLWQKEHPRAKGTPDTSIALVLGCNDGYIGAASTPWAQHANRWAHANDTFSIFKPDQKINIWASSHPEENWLITRQGVFRSCNTMGVSGTPYGQTDVVQVDDESRLSDLDRYKLLVFGGWNTMKEPAAVVLRRWMENGGTLFMCAPQLTTRIDRNYLDYAIADLMPIFPDIRFTGFSEADGFMDNGPACPENFHPVFGWPAAEGRPQKRGAWCSGKVRLVDVEDTAPDGSAPLETVITIEGQPLIARRRVGKGWFYLMLSRDFPVATPHTSRVWTGLIHALADRVPQHVTLRASDPDPAKDERRFFIFSAYPDTAYVMNLDWEKPHSVVVELPGGKSEALDLAPLEIRIFPLPAK